MVTNKENLISIREEAIELINQGYLAKAIMLLEKEIEKNPENNFPAFELIKRLALEGNINSKNEFISLVNMV